MAWIRVVTAEEADGDLLDVYKDNDITSGSMFPPYEVLTNNGPALKALQTFSHTLRFGDSPLSRFQREMIATLTASATHCLF